MQSCVRRAGALGLSAAWLGVTAGCADVRMAGFDNTTGVVRYCGNSHAYHDQIVSAARDDCAAGRRLKTLRCDTAQTGAHASTVAVASGVSSTIISPRYGECCEFRCEAPM